MCILGFLKQTLLPKNNVSLMAVDARMETRMKNTLKDYGIELIEIPPCSGLAEPVAGHVDMQLIHVGDNVLVCQPGLPSDILKKLKEYGFDVYTGNTLLQKDYPLDVAYNVAIVGQVAFHNTKCTDKVVAEFLSRFNIRLVHVNQGYAKCSVLPVSTESIITDDPSIAKAARKEGFNVLQIPPQKNILLPGYSYGFIGGVAGFIDKDLIAFAGNIDMLDSSDEIKDFLKEYGVKWVNLDSNGIHDYGSLIPLYEKDTI
ncbi:DUF6873 family GME fold protein [Thermoclostridium stercorarium]|uniref:DUF6873 family GME fold protein n=1 Tax=Thermoclostridium stercorarium TaxID=1510 RepID=UPI0020930165|nr:hypothetical protein [Thermoclostridium stercorarium]